MAESRKVFSVLEVIVHYKYKMLELKPRPEENGRDLALLRLDRDAVRAGLEPICLPPGRRFPDDVGIIKGYTEGWGTDTDSTGECITGEEGPAPFQPCQERTIIPVSDGGPPKIYQAGWRPLIGPGLSRYSPLIGGHLTILAPKSMP